MRVPGSASLISFAARTPPPAGMSKSSSTTSGRRSATASIASSGVLGLADELEAGGALGERAEREPDRRVVVGDDDADRRRRVGRRPEHVHAVAPGRLGLVERLVGLLEQLVGRARDRRARDAGADGDDAAVGMRELQRLDRRAQPLGRVRRGVQRLLGQQDEELLAAVAVDRVADADRGSAAPPATARSTSSPATWPAPSL